MPTVAPLFPPSDPLARELFDQIASWPIYDPHSHIDPHAPGARHLDEVLGYHYYTELCHSAGMPAALVDPALSPDERVANLAGFLDRIGNTVQYSWLVEIAHAFHGIDLGPVAALADSARKADADGPAWDESVWQTTGLECVFLTNHFDDPLTGWDTRRYVPCLRTDDLVLKLSAPATRERLQQATGIDAGDQVGFRRALGAIFERFVANNARACAISLPPDFAPHRPGPSSTSAIAKALSSRTVTPDEAHEARAAAFWLIAELCQEHRLPFDLMIGPIRDIYPAGVAGGRDLFDRRVSLADYRTLFNHFAGVTFPVSTLSPDAAGELVAYAWIFPNVVPMGHWWYSNIPAFIAPDLRARLQALPMTKPIAYYSDAYKLEFILPKFNMYRRVLSEVLADEVMRGRGGSADQALAIARRILLENPRDLFGRTRAGSTPA